MIVFLVSANARFFLWMKNVWRTILQHYIAGQGSLEGHVRDKTIIKGQRKDTLGHMRDICQNNMSSWAKICMQAYGTYTPSRTSTTCTEVVDKVVDDDVSNGRLRDFQAVIAHSHRCFAIFMCTCCSSATVYIFYTFSHTLSPTSYIVVIHHHFTLSLLALFHTSLSYFIT